jgi:hypothetical protein
MRKTAKSIKNIYSSADEAGFLTSAFKNSNTVFIPALETVNQNSI